jgi:hypothetical protein
MSPEENVDEERDCGGEIAVALIPVPSASWLSRDIDACKHT